MKSTGPQDTSKTRFNGIKHGLTAMHALLPWENKDDLQAIVESFEERYQPSDKVERLLVKQVAEAYWRMERSLRVEACTFEVLAAAEAQAADQHRDNMHAGHLEAIGFLKAGENMDRIRRYDAHLQRAFDNALARVEKMASLRRPGAEPLPLTEIEPVPSKKHLKVCVLHLPLPKNKPVQVYGEILDDAPEAKEEAATSAHAQPAFSQNQEPRPEGADKQTVDPPL